MIYNKIITYMMLMGSLSLSSCVYNQSDYSNDGKDLVKPPQYQSQLKEAKVSTTTLVNGKVLSLRELEQNRSYAVNEARNAFKKSKVKVPSSDDYIVKDNAYVEKKIIKKEKLYSFSIKDKNIKDTLALFAISNHVNIIPDADIDGKITVSFKDVTLTEALKSILDAAGYYWVFDGNLIKVKNIESKIFNVDYPKMIRTGSINNNATLGSGSSGNSGSSTSGLSNSSSSSNSNSSSNSGVSIGNENSVDFWGSLNKELSRLLSKNGTVIINSLAGTVNVVDKHINVLRIEKYLNDIDDSIHRQVVIAADVFEVTRNDNSQFGIDWNRVTSNLVLNAATAITNPIAGASAVPMSAINLTLKNRGDTFKGVVSALKEQGNIKVISRPHILTLNNQPAMIKVGTDKTFFKIETSTTNTTSGTNTITNDVPQNITIGFIMSIVPQISKDGKVILDISPVITSLSGTDTSINGSTAPILDIKQLSSIVRVNSGETIVVGGLIRDEISDTRRSVPILGDIPFIGGFFSSKLKVKNKSELVVFITPYVINEKK